MLEMPGQLDPYETVAVYPKVTGFVKSIRVDRGSRVRTAEPMAELEVPELVAQRAEAQSKLQAAEAELAVARDHATGRLSDYLGRDERRRVNGANAGERVGHRARDGDRRIRMSATSVAPVASVLASSATATLPPASRSPMIP